MTASFLSVVVGGTAPLCLLRWVLSWIQAIVKRRRRRLRMAATLSPSACR